MKDIVLTDKGPKPIGPYSQAVKSNGFLFASGQVALDPRNNEFLGGDIRQQTERALENLKGILEASGAEDISSSGEKATSTHGVVKEPEPVHR